MRGLIEKMFAPAFKNPILEQMGDGAVFSLGEKRMAFTTDSYVVNPLFFPGGDIGSLAVNGTVNDLAMCGAKPIYLSAGFILEEGLPMETLWKIVQSMQAAAVKAKVKLVTGDTKVVDKGKGDGIYINTAGIGILEHNLDISPENIKPNDVIILNGDIGRHGIAIMAQREGLAFKTTIESDCAPLNGMVAELLSQSVEIHCMRDLTRGGLASVLVEIAESTKVEIEIEERRIPVLEEVQGACEILGLEPIYVANEGRFVCFMPQKEARKAMEIMRSHPLGKDAEIIGKAVENKSQMVTMQSVIGTKRVLDMLSGEQLPRIC
jgi:hydrogenase expression/formation protein HypE